MFPVFLIEWSETYQREVHSCPLATNSVVLVCLSSHIGNNETILASYYQPNSRQIYMYEHFKASHLLLEDFKKYNLFFVQLLFKRGLSKTPTPRTNCWQPENYSETESDRLRFQQAVRNRDQRVASTNQRFPEGLIFFNTEPWSHHFYRIIRPS